MTKKIKTDDSNDFQGGTCGNCGYEKKSLFPLGDYGYCRACLKIYIEELLRNKLNFSTLENQKYFDMQEKRIASLERMVELKDTELKDLESFYRKLIENQWVQIGELEEKLKRKK